MSIARSAWMRCGLFAVAIVAVTSAEKSAAADQHSLEAIIAALQSPISPQALAAARKYDDDILSSGQSWSHQIYLVTDERYARVKRITDTVLQAAGQDPNQWVVRVLDSDPKVVNAFVVGGKYIYVWTGLLDLHPSDDELGLILAHETGHSMLKHLERRQDDASTTWAGLANLAALLSPKNKDALSTISTSISSTYSRGDEEEADAIGVCIARQAGFDPMRGLNFFTGMIRQRDQHRQERQRTLDEAKAAYDQALANCMQNKNLFNSSRSYQTQENANKVNAMCADAEKRRLHYNQVVEWYNADVASEQRNVLLADHPLDQTRVATVTALVDYLAGRRDVETLTDHQQSYRVMKALGQVRPELLKESAVVAAPTVARADSAAAPPSGKSLEQQLLDLKRAHDQGLITDAEYERKRQEILARY
ncbi:MAG: M48 family metalloprotease [Candidatus Eisenbacteria bacterium]|nr:M48 family metalloprotease [Candidatus Eisenbacteria bacterium]